MKRKSFTDNDKAKWFALGFWAGGTYALLVHIIVEACK